MFSSRAAIDHSDGVYGFGFDQPIRAVILGARGGVGAALASQITQRHEANRVLLTSRQPERSSHIWERLDITSPSSWSSLVDRLHDELQRWDGELNLVINATGLLHRAAENDQAELMPERSLKGIELASMEEVFAVNTFGVALALKHLTPLLPRAQRSIFASFSARVGSIGDNRIGGWYSYRASKAAQNMLIKNAAIELARTKRACICVAVHPGTVATELSAPFTKSVKHTIFTPEESASHLLKVFTELTTERSGESIAWDGVTIIP